MKEHTTHFEDCGCLAAQHAAEIAKALAERDTWMRTCQRLRVESALVSGALCDAMTVVVDPPHEGVKQLTAELAAAIREADRLRHGLEAIREVQTWVEQNKRLTDSEDEYMVYYDLLCAKLTEMERG